MTLSRHSYATQVPYSAPNLVSNSAILVPTLPQTPPCLQKRESRIVQRLFARPAAVGGWHTRLQRGRRKPVLATPHSASLCWTPNFWLVRLDLEGIWKIFHMGWVGGPGHSSCFYIIFIYLLFSDSSPPNSIFLSFVWLFIQRSHSSLTSTFFIVQRNFKNSKWVVSQVRWRGRTRRTVGQLINSSLSHRTIPTNIPWLQRSLVCSLSSIWCNRWDTANGDK